MPRKVILLLAFTIINIAYLSAQDKVKSSPSNRSHPPALELLEKKILSSEMSSIFVHPIRCDSNGNVYMRDYQSGSTTVGPLRKINPRDGGHTIFSTVVPDLVIFYVATFVVDDHGNVYQLVVGADKNDREPEHDSVYVVSYDKDGSVKSKVYLGYGVRPAQLAVFRSGEFLITGMKVDPAKGPTSSPMTGLYAADGSLIREVTFPDDQDIRDSADSGDERVADPGQPSHNHVIFRGDTTVAEDGNAYVLRWRSPAEIYVVSAAGRVLRRLTIDPGDHALMPTVMQVSGSRIALLFFDSTTESYLLKVVDIEGKEVATYSDAEIGGALACFSSQKQQLTFLSTSDKGNLALSIVQTH
jgi:hypothetical protein